MLTAIDAKKLYESPPLTLEEIEGQIKEAAKGRNYTCFDVVRISQETRSALIGGRVFTSRKRYGCNS